MPKYPFTRPPSAAPPGSSYYLSNALIIAKRTALGFEDPVRIQSGEWKAGNPLHDWYERNEYTPVVTMQLRKEKKKPFFHEYIAFQLGDGKCFRIDRRQLPDEQSPMDCAGEYGAEAYDTIEQIVNLDDSMYNPSDCLVQVDFGGGPLWLGRITYICRTISQHKRSGVYTVQRYNCYFYAQTILLYTSFFAHLRVGGDLWHPRRRHATQLYASNREQQPLKMRLATWYELIISPNVKVKWVQPNPIEEPDLNDLREYLSTMIHAHSVRIEQYKLILGCSAKEVEWGVKESMNEIWRDTLESRVFMLDQHKKLGKMKAETYGIPWSGDRVSSVPANDGKRV